MGFEISAINSLPNPTRLTYFSKNNYQSVPRPLLYRSRIPQIRKNPKESPPKSRSSVLIVVASAAGGGGGGSGGGGGGKRTRSGLNLRWRDLLLDPDPDNVVAVGLAALLTWASVQVLWQILVISVAILLAALKYSFIAALLLFILITLL